MPRKTKETPFRICLSQMNLNMQIRHVLLLLLVLGAVAEGRRVRRVAIPFLFNLRDDMVVLKIRMKKVETKTENALQGLLQDIEKSRENTTQILSQDLQDTADAFLGKLQKELERAKTEATSKDVETVLSCVEEEQKNYATGYGENYVTSLVCVKNATEAATEWITNINKTFRANSFVDEAHAKHAEEKWTTCLQSSDFKCTEAVENEFERKINHTKQESATAIEKGKEVIPKFTLKTGVCVSKFKKGLTGLEDKHKKVLQECIKNPA